MTGLITRPSDALALHQDTVREVLPNGLTLLVRRDTSAPVVAIVTHVKAGYFDETDDIIGIAHVLEHMFFKGTPTRGVGQIARETKANGGYLNAHTIYDHTSYYTVLPSSSFVPGLEIQFDAYARSVIDGEELARELEVIIQEAKRKKDTAYAVAIETLYAVMHDRHRIRRWRIGEETGLRTFTREHLLSFYRHWYRPDNTVLSIVGDIDIETVRREVMSRYGSLDAGRPARDHGPQETSAAGVRFHDWAGDIAQQHVAFGWRVPSLRHEDTPALDLAGVALGSGRASRLYRAVREQQLASAVTAWNYTAGDVGVFVAHVEAPAATARAAATATWRELQAARLDGFRASELTRAQRILEARWLRRLESMDGQAQYLASWEAEGGLDVGAQYYDTLLTTDVDRVQQAMLRYLDPSQVTVVSYRPNGAEPLAASVDDVGELLANTPTGSTVMSSPAVPTPVRSATISHTRVDAPALHLRAAGTVDHGVHIYRTAHGVPVLVMPRPGAPLVNIGVVQRGGAAVDEAHHEGLARLTAQTMLKGTRTRTGAQLAEASEELGGSIGVSVGLESLGWSLSVPVRHVASATMLLADVLQEPVFHADAIATERTLALAELARARDDMHRWPMRLASLAAYGDHPYARSTIGTDASLPLLDAAAVQHFHERHIKRSASVVAVVGDVTPDDIAVLIERQFGGLTWQEGHALPDAVWPQQARALHESRAKQQTAIALLFPGPSRNDSDRFAARVLSAIASGLGGRFFEQLRDKQSLAYTVSAFPIERRAGGAFGAYIATDPTREDEARDGLMSEFAKFVNEPPTTEEVERAQRYLIGSHAIAQQSGGNVLGELVDAWLFGEGLHELRETEARLNSVTPSAVQGMAARSFEASRVVEGTVRGELR